MSEQLTVISTEAEKTLEVPTKGKVQKDIVTRWGGDPEILKEKWVAVPNLFLQRASTLKPYPLSPTESLFVICLMSHKWDERAPYPSYKRLAQYLGKTESYSRKLARNLETKGLLKRRQRIGDTSEFDLRPLFAALVRQSAGAAPSVQKTKSSSKVKPLRHVRGGNVKRRTHGAA